MSELVKSIGEVFSNRVFKVPDYQRGYAWRDQQWDDLWQDLELLPQGRNHFTGTLVIKKANNGALERIDDEGHRFIIFEVIDGQQRLSTVILLLKAIFDEMVKFDEFKTLSNGLREMYLYNKDIDGLSFTHLTTNKDAQDYFYKYILSSEKDIIGPKNRSEKLLSEGRRFYSKKLLEKEQQFGKDFPAYLKDLYFRITQQLTLIVYEVDDDLEAGVIFETMNDRGKPLTDLDKVKNHLLYLCSKLDITPPARADLNDRINRTWSHIFEEMMVANLGDDNNENQLLRVHWLMIYDYDPRNWNKSRSIKDKFNLKAYVERHQELLTDLNTYLDSLKDATTAYCDLLRPTRTGAFNEISDTNLRKQIQISSERLARLGARASFQPLLISVRMKAGDNGDTYLKAVDLCERYDFRVYGWERRQTRAGQSALFRLGNEFYKFSNFETLSNGIRQIVWQYSPDTKFIKGFDNEFENWYEWSHIKYFLYEYEQYLADSAGKPVKMPWDLLQQSRKEDTIEHILPQSPTDEYWQTRFTPEEMRRWTHDIGNLTLTYDNSPLTNKPFKKGKEKYDDKVSYYEDSNLFIEKSLKNYPEWSVQAIEKRRNQIREWALERWKIEPPTMGSDTGGLIEGSFADLSPEERRAKYLQGFLDRADQMGNGSEFRQLLDIAQKFPLFMYLNPKYGGIKFSTPSDRRTWMIWVSPDLYISLDLTGFDKTFGLPNGETEKIIGSQQHKLKRDDVKDFVVLLENLLQRITLS